MHSRTLNRHFRLSLRETTCSSSTYRWMVFIRGPPTRVCVCGASKRKYGMHRTCFEQPLLTFDLRRRGCFVIQFQEWYYRWCSSTTFSRTHFGVYVRGGKLYCRAFVACLSICTVCALVLPACAYLSTQCCADPALPPVEQDGEFVSMTLEPARRYQRPDIANPTVRTARCGSGMATGAGQDALPLLPSSFRGSSW